LSHAFRAQAGIRFSGFLLDAVNQCLWSLDGAPAAPAAAGARSRVDLPPKTFDVLRYLAEHANELVRPAQVLDAVWPDAYVQPEIIKSHIAAIRRALGDSAAHPRIVETVSSAARRSRICCLTRCAARIRANVRSCSWRARQALARQRS
jgi:DNA-binding response OmpR family regulator